MVGTGALALPSVLTSGGWVGTPLCRIYCVHIHVRVHLAIYVSVDILPSFMCIYFMAVSLNAILTSHLVVSNGDQYLGGLFLLIVACARWVGNLRDPSSRTQNLEPQNQI